jgi:hypothetical protein
LLFVFFSSIMLFLCFYKIYLERERERERERESERERARERASERVCEREKVRILTSTLD